MIIIRSSIRSQVLNLKTLPIFSPLKRSLIIINDLSVNPFPNSSLDDHHRVALIFGHQPILLAVFGQDALTVCHQLILLGVYLERNTTLHLN